MTRINQRDTDQLRAQQAQAAEREAAQKKSAEIEAARAAEEAAKKQEAQTPQELTGEGEPPAENSQGAEGPAEESINLVTSTQPAQVQQAPAKEEVAKTSSIQVSENLNQPAVKDYGAGVGVVTSQTVETVDALEESLKRILTDVPLTRQMELHRVQEYVKAMHPLHPIDPEEGAKQQLALYRSLQTLINRQEEYFNPLFTALLRIISANRTYTVRDEVRPGVFNELYRNRFMEHVALSSADRKAFLSIMHLLCIMADPKSRNLALKQINLEKALENGLTEDGKSRVVGYFS